MNNYDQMTLAELAATIGRWADAGLRYLDQVPAVIPWVVTTVTATYAMQPFDRVVLADTTAGAITVTIPSAVGRLGQQPLVVKRVSAGGNNVTIASAGGTIDGAATSSLASQYASITVVSNGTNWSVI